MSHWKTKIFVRRREERLLKDKFAVWVTMPDGDEYNIWDFSKKEITQNLLGALDCAFRRGWEAHSQLTVQNLYLDVTPFDARAEGPKRKKTKKKKVRKGKQ